MCKGELIVSNSNDCQKLLENHWSKIVVKEGCCNSLTIDLMIQANPCLVSIKVEKRSLMNVKSLKVINNNELVLFETDGVTDFWEGPFFYTNTVTFERKL